MQILNCAFQSPTSYKGVNLPKEWRAVNTRDASCTSTRTSKPLAGVGLLFNVYYANKVYEIEFAISNSRKLYLKSSNGSSYIFHKMYRPMRRQRQKTEIFVLTIDNNAPCLKFIWNDKSRGWPSADEPCIKPLEVDNRRSAKSYVVKNVKV